MCLNRARTDLRGGRAAMPVPTAKAVVRVASRSHQLYLLSGQPVPLPVGRGRLRVAAGAASERQADDAGLGAGHHLARTPAQAGRVDRTFHPAPRAAPAQLRAMAPGLLPGGAGVGCRPGLSAPHLQDPLLDGLKRSRASVPPGTQKSTQHRTFPKTPPCAPTRPLPMDKWKVVMGYATAGSDREAQYT